MDGCPLGLGLVVEDKPTEFLCDIHLLLNSTTLCTSVVKIAHGDSVHVGALNALL